MVVLRVLVGGTHAHTLIHTPTHSLTRPHTHSYTHTLTHTPTHPQQRHPIHTHLHPHTHTTTHTPTHTLPHTHLSHESSVLHPDSKPRILVSVERVYAHPAIRHLEESWERGRERYHFIYCIAGNFFGGGGRAKYSWFSFSHYFRGCCLHCR